MFLFHTYTEDLSKKIMIPCVEKKSIPVKLGVFDTITFILFDSYNKNCFEFFHVKILYYIQIGQAKSNLLLFFEIIREFWRFWLYALARWALVPYPMAYHTKILSMFLKIKLQQETNLLRRTDLHDPQIFISPGVPKIPDTGPPGSRLLFNNRSSGGIVVTAVSINMLMMMAVVVVFVVIVMVVMMMMMPTTVRLPADDLVNSRCKGYPDRASGSYCRLGRLGNRWTTLGYALFDRFARFRVLVVMRMMMRLGTCRAINRHARVLDQQILQRWCLHVDRSRLRETSRWCHVPWLVHGPGILCTQKKNEILVCDENKGVISCNYEQFVIDSQSALSSLLFFFFHKNVLYYGEFWTINYARDKKETFTDFHEKMYFIAS